MNSYLIVGDAYEKFAENKSVMGISSALRRFAEERQHLDGVRVVIGQGIAEDERERLLELLAASDAEIEAPAELVPLSLTHKTRRQHVLIGGGRLSAPHCYEYQFVLDDADDRLCDHVTGQHVSAMLLMEAGRQAVIASLEQQYPTTAGSKWGIVLGKLTASFSSYAFPIPTGLQVRILLIGEQTPKSVNAALVVTFRQAGAEVCRMQFDVQLCKQAALDNIEGRKARGVIETLLAEQSTNAMLV